MISQRVPMIQSSVCSFLEQTKMGVIHDYCMSVEVNGANEADKYCAELVGDMDTNDIVVLGSESVSPQILQKIMGAKLLVVRDENACFGVVRSVLERRPYCVYGANGAVKETLVPACNVLLVLEKKVESKWLLGRSVCL